MAASVQRETFSERTSAFNEKIHWCNVAIMSVVIAVLGLVAAWAAYGYFAPNNCTEGFLGALYRDVPKAVFIPVASICGTSTLIGLIGLHYLGYRHPT